MKIIALIPARSGSERLKNKNILKINKKPLLYYAINSAKQSGIFNKIIVSTDSKKYQKIAEQYGAEVPFLRPKKIATAKSTDFQWVNHAINYYKKKKKHFDFFFILRPTNPFRTSNTIIKAWNFFKKNKADSLRAVEPCKQHPYKMWVIKKKHDYARPLFKKKINKEPAYNNQFKSLPLFFIQNASIEISKTSVLKKNKTITGKKIIPFFTNELEGFDINYKKDIIDAQLIYKQKIKK